uniref:Cell division protein n=1 Tax=Jenufa minuta TaxID=993092 RepID=A0A0S2LNH5_JENMI|nr:cell division protein [Jenufa minuta]ALO62944.1 cell division protein [Jenufa minuta]
MSIKKFLRKESSTIVNGNSSYKKYFFLYFCLPLFGIIFIKFWKLVNLEKNQLKCSCSAWPLSHRVIFSHRNLKNKNLSKSIQINRFNGSPPFLTEFFKNLCINSINLSEKQSRLNIYDSEKKSNIEQYEETTRVPLTRVNDNFYRNIRKNLLNLKNSVGDFKTKMSRSETNDTNHIQNSNPGRGFTNLTYTYYINWLNTNDLSHDNLINAASVERVKTKFMTRMLPVEQFKYTISEKLKNVPLGDLFTESMNCLMNGNIYLPWNLSSLFSYEKGVFFLETYLKNACFDLGIDSSIWNNYFYPKDLGSTLNRVSQFEVSDFVNAWKINSKDSLTIVNGADRIQKPLTYFWEVPFVYWRKQNKIVSDLRFPIIGVWDEGLNKLEKKCLPDSTTYKSFQVDTTKKVKHNRVTTVKNFLLNTRPVKFSLKDDLKSGLNICLVTQKLKHIFDSSFYSHIFQLFPDLKDLEEDSNLQNSNPIKWSLLPISYYNSYISNNISKINIPLMIANDKLCFQKKEKYSNFSWSSREDLEKVDENMFAHLVDLLYELKIVIRESLSTINDIKKYERSVNSSIRNDKIRKKSTTADYKEIYVKNIIDFINKSNDLRYSQINLNLSNFVNLRDFKVQVKKIQISAKNIVPKKSWIHGLTINKTKSQKLVGDQWTVSDRKRWLNKIYEPIEKRLSTPFFDKNSTLCKLDLYGKNGKSGLFKIKKRFKSYNEIKLKCIKKKCKLYGWDKRKYEKLFQRFISYKSNYGWNIETKGVKHEQLNHTRMRSIKNRLRLQSKNFILNKDNKLSLINNKNNKILNVPLTSEVRVNDARDLNQYSRDQHQRGSLTKLSPLTKLKNIYIYASYVDLHKWIQQKTLFIDQKTKKTRYLIPLNNRLSPSELFKKKFFIKNVQAPLTTPVKVNEKGRFFANKDLQKERRLFKLQQANPDDEYRQPLDQRPVFLDYRTFKRYLIYRYPLGLTNKDRDLKNTFNESNQSFTPTRVVKDTFNRKYNKILYKLNFISKGYLKNASSLEFKANRHNGLLDTNKLFNNYPYIYYIRYNHSPNNLYSYKNYKSVLSYLKKPNLDKTKYKTLYFNVAVGKNVKKKIYRPHATCTYDNPNTQKIVLHNMCTRKNIDGFSFYAKRLYEIPQTIKKRYKRKSWSSSWVRYYFPTYLKRVESRLKDVRKYYKKENAFKIYKTIAKDFEYNKFDTQLLNLEKTPFSISKMYLKNFTNYDSKSSLLHQDFKVPLTLVGDWSDKLNFGLSDTKPCMSYMKEYDVYSQYEKSLYKRVIRSFRKIRKNITRYGVPELKFFNLHHMKSYRNKRKPRKFVANLKYQLFENRGDSTLRVFWALKKSNLLTYKEKNTIQDVWNSYMKRDQIKFDIFSVADLTMNDFEKFCFLKLLNKEAKLEMLGSLKANVDKKTPTDFLLKKHIKNDLRTVTLPHMTHGEYPRRESTVKLSCRGDISNVENESSGEIGEALSEKLYEYKFLQLQNRVKSIVNPYLENLSINTSKNYWWSMSSFRHLNIQSMSSKYDNNDFIFSFQYPLCIKSDLLYVFTLTLLTFCIHVMFWKFVSNIPEIRSFFTFRSLVFWKMVKLGTFLVTWGWKKGKLGLAYVRFLCNYIWMLITEFLNFSVCLISVYYKGPIRDILLFNKDNKNKKSKSKIASYEDNWTFHYKHYAKWRTKFRENWNLGYSDTWKQNLPEEVKKGFVGSLKKKKVIKPKRLERPSDFALMLQKQKITSYRPLVNDIFESKNNLQSFNVPFPMVNNSKYNLDKLHHRTKINPHHQQVKKRCYLQIAYKKYKYTEWTSTFSIVPLDNKSTFPFGYESSPQSTYQRWAVLNYKNSLNIGYIIHPIATFVKKFNLTLFIPPKGGARPDQRVSRDWLNFKNTHIYIYKNIYENLYNQIHYLKIAIKNRVNMLLDIYKNEKADIFPGFSPTYTWKSKEGIDFFLRLEENKKMLYFLLILVRRLYLIFIYTVSEYAIIILVTLLFNPLEAFFNWIWWIFLSEWHFDRNLRVSDYKEKVVWKVTSQTIRGFQMLSVPMTLLLRFIKYNYDHWYFNLHKPDSDGIYRRKKAMLYWRVWANIIREKIYDNNLDWNSLSIKIDEYTLLLLEKDDWYEYFLNSPNTLPYDLWIEDAKLSNINKSFVGHEMMAKNTSSMSPFLTYIEPKKNRYSHKKRLKMLPSNRRYDRFLCYQNLNVNYPYSEFFSEVYVQKSLSDLFYLKSYAMNNYVLCNYICQIYNHKLHSAPEQSCLVYGPAGSVKTEFIKAMAGETEFTCVISHSHKYSIIDRDVAVGLRYLKWVLESIVNHIPCMFVLEDIHLIGEKRPLSYYDDETVYAGLDKSRYGVPLMSDTVKNTVFGDYQRHHLLGETRYTKTEYSPLIIKNYYSYSLFMGVSPPRSRGTFEGPDNPYNLLYLNDKLNPGNNKVLPILKSEKFPIQHLSPKLTTVIQVPQSEIYVPPPTSPMAVFELKEKKKFKPGKMMPEILWRGLTWDEYMIMTSTPNYLIQIKVFLLAQLAITNYVAKVDMLLDLLQVMDEIKRYRGLLMFGTTHCPNVLDPALRRPGRFLFMIRIPFVPNWSARLEMFKVGLDQYSKTFDNFDYSLMCKNYKEAQICHLVSRIKIIFDNYEFDGLAPVIQNKSVYEKSKAMYNGKKFLTTTVGVNDALSYTKVLTHSLRSEFNSYNIGQIRSVYNLESYDVKNMLLEDSTMLGIARCMRRFFEKSYRGQNKDSLFSKPRGNVLSRLRKSKKMLLDHLRRLSFYSYVPAGPSNILGITYSTVSKLLLGTQMYKDVTSFGFVISSFKHHTLSESSANHTFNCLYYSMERLNIELLRLFSGKIGEFFLYSAVNRPDVNWFNQIPFLLNNVNNIWSLAEDNLNIKLVKNNGMCQDYIVVNDLSGKVENVDRESTVYFTSGEDSLDSTEQWYVSQELSSDKIEALSSTEVFYRNAQMYSPNGTKRVFSFPEGLPKKSNQQNTLNDSCIIVDKEKVKHHMSLYGYGQSFKNFSHTFYTCYGCEDKLSSVTNIAYSLMYKRYMYSKALFLERSLSVINNSMNYEPITAPSSSIDTPSDRYEHMKRYEKAYLKKSVISIRKKLEEKEYWLYVRYLSSKPRLQGYPFSVLDLENNISDNKGSEPNASLSMGEKSNRLLSNYKTIHRKFSFAPIDLLPLGKDFTQTSQSAYYIRKVYDNRNRYTFYDFWYNFHLEEDTLEKTMSLETDCRYYYDEMTGDWIIEYPDADQYYNPRNRRWMCASGYWSQWGNFEKLYQQEIYTHYLYESFYRGFKFLENYRLVLDNVAYKLLKNGMLKEIDLKTFIKL